MQALVDDLKNCCFNITFKHYKVNSLLLSTVMSIQCLNHIMKQQTKLICIFFSTAAGAHIKHNARLKLISSVGLSKLILPKTLA